MQAIYQNPFIQHGAVIKYSCFSLRTHPDIHTVTHTHKGIYFSFSLLKKRRNLYSMLPLTRLGHFPWRPAPLEVTVKRELGKKKCDRWVCLIHIIFFELGKLQFFPSKTHLGNRAKTQSSSWLSILTPMTIITGSLHNRGVFFPLLIIPELPIQRSLMFLIPNFPLD